MKKNLTFSVVGTSALGMPLLNILVRHFKKLNKVFLIDPDTWQRSEQNKHIHSSRAQTGKQKTTYAKELINQYNPKIKVLEVAESSRSKSAQKAMKQSDIIIACVDNDPSRLEHQVYASLHKKTLLDLSAEIQKQERIGTTRIYIPGKTSCIVCQGLPLNNIMTDSLREAKQKTGYLKGTAHNPRSVALLDTETACIGLTLLLNHLEQPKYAVTTISLNQNKHEIKKLTFKPKEQCKLCTAPIKKGVVSCLK